jgi:hypothetical protein
MDPDPELADVLLIPQYHYRPFNILDWAGRRCMIAYPAGLQSKPGADRYSLRPAAIDSLGPRLHAFLKEE